MLYSIVTKRQSRSSHSIQRAQDSRLVLKIPISSYGTWLARPVLSGQFLHFPRIQWSHLFSRLRGHRDQITGIRFLDVTSSHLPSTSSGKSNSFGYLVTCSKDTFLKVWDLSTAHCVQTIIAHHSEIWSLDLNPDGNIIFTGSGEGEVKAWKVDVGALESGMRETERGGVSICVRITPM